MVWKSAALIAAAMAFSGCAQERGTAVFGYQTTRAPEAADIDSELEARHLGKKSMAAKVLAAIALERVTGRKPDPARLTELD
ncbi:MAG: hypothetical protein KJZ80_00475 [Hyphomicrobiaceae bacterium]|nr:hypothetical protein [Hyphomicrobiaceae bacterium]